MLEFGKEYRPSKVSDYSSIIKNVPNTRIYNYYMAESFMENYNLPIVLLGTRRLGKTTVLNQLWDKFHNTNSRYLHIEADTDFDEVFSIIWSYVHEGIESIYIDEITNIIALDSNIATLLDCVIVSNTKLVCTGTCSLLLELTLNAQAAGRFNIIRFNPPIYADYLSLNNTTFHDFMLGINTFYNGESYIKDLSCDIYNAISRCTNKYVCTLLEDLSEDDIHTSIKSILEKCFIFKDTGRIYPIKFRKKYYELDDSFFQSDKDKFILNDRNIIQEIFNCLLRLHIFTSIQCYNIHEPYGDQGSNTKLYLNTPILYRELLDMYEVIPNKTKEGFIFEAAALTQIIYLIQGNHNITYYYIRTSEGDLEYDLVIQTPTDVYLIDFKRSSTKINKYKNLKEVLKFYNKIDPSLRLHFQTVYLIKNEDISYEESYFINDYLEIIKNLTISVNNHK